MSSKSFGKVFYEGGNNEEIIVRGRKRDEFDFLVLFQYALGTVALSFFTCLLCMFRTVSLYD